MMQMDAGLDTGAMLKKLVIPIAPQETGGSLFEKLKAAGGPLLLETLREVEAGTIEAVPQTGESCYASMLDKAMGDVDWSQSAERIERWIRGLNPWPSAYTCWKEKTLKLWRAEVLPEDSKSGEENGKKAPPGTILSLKDGIAVQTGGGVLRIRELQMEGKKRMDAEAFLRGAHMEAGDILSRRRETDSSRT